MELAWNIPIAVRCYDFFDCQKDSYLSMNSRCNKCLKKGREALPLVEVLSKAEIKKEYPYIPSY